MNQNRDLEYRTIWLKDIVDDFQYVTSAGSQGWELLQIVHDPKSDYGNGGYQAVFKRYAEDGLQTTTKQAQEALAKTSARDSLDECWTFNAKHFQRPPTADEIQELGDFGNELVNVVWDPISGGFVAYFKRRGVSPSYQKFLTDYQRQEGDGKVEEKAPE